MNQEEEFYDDDFDDDFDSNGGYDPDYESEYTDRDFLGDEEGYSIEENPGRRRRAEADGGRSLYGDSPYGENDFRRGDAGRKRRKTSRRRRGRRSAAEFVILGILAAVFAVSLFMVVSQLMAYQTAVNEYDALSVYFEAIPASETGQDAAVEMADTAEGAGTEGTAGYPVLAVDYESLTQINPEFVGIISLPALDLIYPMVQTTDNTSYLTKTFEGTVNSSGCIYLDTVASPDFSDWNSFIFGHNMKNLTMFGSLKLFQQDPDLCDTNPYIYIYQEDQILIYRIFAYYTIPVDDDVYDDFYDEGGYDAYVEDALSRSIYTPGDDIIDWTQRPNLLTLSTCYATGHTQNFIVQGALIGKAVQQ